MPVPRLAELRRRQLAAVATAVSRAFAGLFLLRLATGIYLTWLPGTRRTAYEANHGPPTGACGVSPRYRRAGHFGSTILLPRNVSIGFWSKSAGPVLAHEGAHVANAISNPSARLAQSCGVLVQPLRVVAPEPLASLPRSHRRLCARSSGRRCVYPRFSSDLVARSAGAADWKWRGRYGRGARVAHSRYKPTGPCEAGLGRSELEVGGLCRGRHLRRAASPTHFQRYPSGHRGWRKTRRRRSSPITYPSIHWLAHRSSRIFRKTDDRSDHSSGSGSPIGGGGDGALAYPPRRRPYHPAIVIERHPVRTDDEPELVSTCRPRGFAGNIVGAARGLHPLWLRFPMSADNQLTPGPRGTYRHPDG